MALNRNNKKHKQRKKTSLSQKLVKFAVVGASVYLVIAFIGGQFQVAQKQQELSDYKDKLETMMVQNQELESPVQSGNEKAYIERIAREKLGLAKPHERVFIDMTGR